MAHGWSLATMFVPLGYAVSRTLGPGAPIPALLALAASAACLHRLTPRLVEMTAGCGALLLSVFAAADDRSVGATLGLPGIGVVFVFGGVVTASSFVRLLGSGSLREAARHLIAGGTALELSLILLGPASGALGAPRSAALAALLTVGVVVGVRSPVGFPLLGLGLLVAHGAFGASGVPALVPAHVGFLGSTTFAFVALWLRDAGRDDIGQSGWHVGRRAEAA